MPSYIAVKINGKSAIEWIMERYQITTHKESGIKNDPNDWADEVGNPRYILDLPTSSVRNIIKFSYNSKYKNILCFGLSRMV